MNATTNERARATQPALRYVTVQPAVRPRDEMSNRAGSRRRRFQLQAQAGVLLPLERVAHCCRTPHGATVDVVMHHQQGVASFAGLQTCGSVWLCPVCATKISERRGRDLGDGIRRWEELGGRIALVTFTVRHQLADDLEATLDGLLAARKRLVSGKRAKQFASRFGLVGRVRALETTTGLNGWHPHFHEVLFLEGEVDVEALGADLQERWVSAVAAVANRKFGQVIEHAVKVSYSGSPEGQLTIAEYVTKFGRERSWGPERELAKQVTKNGRAGGRTPIALLVDAFEGDEEAGRLWREYGRVFKGRRQLTWSPGLRKLLGLDEEKTDQELAAEEVRGGELVVQIETDEWWLVVGFGARVLVLEAAERGGAPAVRKLLEGLWARLEAGSGRGWPS